jgi:YggT family protein
MIIISYLLTFFELILLARVLLTWFPNIDRRNPIIQFIFDITEPILAPIRNALPQTAMLDFSPIIVFLIIQVLRVVIGI